MKRTISDRMLEKARLGELTESESAELVARLEREEGSTERLDALIAADADFLERFPTGPMAAQIRDRLARETRARQRNKENGETMLSARALMNHRFALAVGLVTVLVGSLALAALWPREAEEGAIPQPTVAARPAPPAPTPAAPVAPPAPAAVDVDPFDAIAHRLADSRELIIEPGESVKLSARGITRVEVDLTKVAAVQLVEDGAKVEITGKEAGLTTVRLHRGSAPPPALFLRVALPYDDPTIVEDVQASNREALEACYDGRPVAAGTFRLLSNPRGSVASVVMQSGDFEPAVADCVTRQMRGWKFPPASDFRTATVSVQGNHE